MTNKKNQDTLKNRFNSVEMSLAEDGIITVDPVVESINSKIETNKIKEIPIVFRYFNFIIRVVKVSIFYVNKTLKTISNEVLAPLLREINKTIVYSFNKSKEIKDQTEVSFDKYLTKNEVKISKKKEVVKEEFNSYELGLKNYKNELVKIFDGISTEVFLECDKNEFLKVSSGLEFDLSLYEQVSLKLIQSNMINNINSIMIKSKVSEKEIINIAEFDLKTSSEKWSRLFSKHLSSEILSKILGHAGVVTNTHLVNLAQSSDVFVLKFTHRRLDFFMNSSVEESNFKIKNKIKNTSKVFEYEA